MYVCGLNGANSMHSINIGKVKPFYVLNLTQRKEKERVVG
jgi:hypothetical protein